MIVDWGLRFNGKGVNVTGSETIAKRVYIAIADAPLTESDVLTYVQSTLSISIGDAHPDTSSMSTFKLKNYDIEVEDGAMTAMVTFNYSNALIGSIAYDNPLDDEPDVSWGTNNETETVFVDQDGTHILNSAGTLYEAMPERITGYTSCSYTRNESISDFTTVTLVTMAFHGVVVNTDIFYLKGVEIPALYARMYISNASYDNRNGINFVRVTYQFDFRAGQPSYTSMGWRVRLDDRGNNEIVGGVRKDLHVNGRPIHDSYPLDGSGVPMPNPDDPPASRGPYKLYKEVAFSVFDFS